MLTEVMEHFSLVKEFPKAGYYETEHQKQMFKDINVAIHSGKLVAITGIIGCGKTTTLRRLFEVLEKEGKITATTNRTTFDTRFGSCVPSRSQACYCCDY